MLIKRIDQLAEFFLWVIVFGLTFSNAFVELGIGFVGGLWIIKNIISKDHRPLKSAVNILLGLLFLIIFISFLRSGYFKASLRGVFKILKYGLLFLSSFDLLRGNKERLERLFRALMIVAALTFINGIFQSIFGFDFIRQKTMIPNDMLRRVSASFVHPNDFAAYIIMVLPLTFCLFSRSATQKKRLILSIIFFLGLWCLLRTSSRGAWLGFVIGLVIFFLYYKPRVAIIVPVLIILLIALSPHGLLRLSALFDFNGGTMWERQEIWKGAWSMIREHPVLGFGINTFSKYFPLYKPADYPDLSYAHNSYLQMWAEIGIVGLVVFLGIIFSLLYKVFRGMKKKLLVTNNGLLLLGMACGYVAFLIHAGLDTNLYSLVLTTLFWLISAYLLALNEQIASSLRDSQ